MPTLSLKIFLLDGPDPQRLGFPRGDAPGILKTGEKLSEGYHPLAVSVCDGLLPRWYGESFWHWPMFVVIYGFYNRVFPDYCAYPLRSKSDLFGYFLRGLPFGVQSQHLISFE